MIGGVSDGAKTPASVVEDMSEVTAPQQHPGDIEHPPIMEGTAFKPSKGMILAFVSLCIITLASALDATSLSIALPTISDRLKGTAIEAFWSGTSFLITSAVFQPVIGGLSYAFGRKHMVLVACLFFATGSLVAALANNFTVLLVGRSIQGVGGGGIVTLTEILVTDLVPLSVRGVWFGYISEPHWTLRVTHLLTGLGAMYAIGTVAGPLMGGGFAQSSHSGWRWIFYINLPIIGVGGIAALLFLKIEKLREKLSTRILQFDWFGSTFFIASSVSFLIPITWGGVMYAWDSWHTLVPLLLGAIGIAGFGLYERWLTKQAFDEEGNLRPERHIHPVIPFSIFSNWTLRLVYLYTFVHGIILWSLLYFLPLYYEGIKGYSPIISGVAVLPETALIAPTAIFVGIVATATGRYRWAIWVGWTLSTLGFGILYLLDTDTSIAAFIFLNIPVSLGTGMGFNSMSLAIQAASRPQDVGYSVTFYSFIRVFGQALGVAIGGVVFQNEIQKNLNAYPALAPLAEQYSNDATALVSVLKNMQPGMEKTQITRAFADSLKMIWVVMAALSGACLLSTLFVKGYTLQQEHKTLQGFSDGSREKRPDGVAEHDRAS